MPTFRGVAIAVASPRRIHIDRIISWAGSIRVRSRGQFHLVVRNKKSPATRVPGLLNAADHPRRERGQSCTDVLGQSERELSRLLAIFQKFHDLIELVVQVINLLLEFFDAIIVHCRH